MAFEVGADVEALCNTCGDVWHVVVAKVGEKITKVECKQCGKQHRFKPTGDAPSANLKPVRTPATPRVRTTPSVATTSSGSSSASAPSIILDPRKPTRPYKISERFSEGEQIQHPKFGPGVVCAVEENKIRVNFSEGTKVLLHGR